MITNPPPYDSAPTLNATHATPPSPATGPAASTIGCPGGRVRKATSTNPQPSRTSTSHGPMVAPAATPAPAYSPQRYRPARPAPARSQLAGTSPAAAYRATAGTAAPAPAANPVTAAGGWAAGTTAERTRMSTSPGTMKHKAPTSAPGMPRRSQAA